MVNIVPWSHEALVVVLLQFEIGVIVSYGRSLFFGLYLILHCVVSWIVSTWKSLDMRRECSIMSDTLLSLNMISFAVVSLNVSSLFHNIKALAWAWQCGNRRLEVAFAWSSLAHFVLSQLFILVQIEFIFSLPEPILTGFTCSTEVLLWSQLFSRVCRFATEKACFCSNHLRGPTKSFLIDSLWVASPCVSLFTIHDIVHWLTSVVVLGQNRTLYMPFSVPIHFVICYTTNSSAWIWLVNGLAASLGNGSCRSRILHSTLISDLWV